MRRAACLSVVAVCFVWCAGPSRAAGDDWRFCVAADFQTRVAYLTPPFESSDAGKDLEGRVSAMLTKENRPFQNVQCRLPTELDQAQAERNDAEAFVKALGLQLTPLQ